MIEVRELTDDEFGRAEVLPLHRFQGFTDRGTYLVAWDGDEPVGHVHIAWSGTEVGVPEFQDVYVVPERRGAGVGTALADAAERLAAARGHDRCSLSVGDANHGARRFYERMGYTRADLPPKRVQGTIDVRGGTIEVDETLLYYEKELVDFAPARSS